MGNEDAVGYGKPPKRTQFKAGQSGNPKGRTKGRRNLKSDLTALLKKRVTIREDGELRHVTRQEAILLSLFEKAIRGDVKAASQMIAMLLRFELSPARCTKLRSVLHYNGLPIDARSISDDILAQEGFEVAKRATPASASSMTGGE